MAAQPEATFTTRQRTVIVRPRDEEEAIQISNGQHLHQVNMKSPTKSEKSHLTMHLPDKKELVHLWDRFTRKGKRKIGVVESIHAIFFSSCKSSHLRLVPT
jgi:Ca2+:H+ antiporter